MQEMDGYAAAAEMRRRGYKGPIIAITGCSLDSDLQRCFSSGFNSYLVKPVNKEQLIHELLCQSPQAT